MAKEYLKDTKFLKALDEMRIKEHFISLQIMNFKEEPIKMIQGMATAGSITINGQSAVRRTINLTMVASEKDNDITNLDNIIACNKKVKVELGIKNPFKEYGDKFFPETGGAKCNFLEQHIQEVIFYETRNAKAFKRY